MYIHNNYRVNILSISSIVSDIDNANDYEYNDIGFHYCNISPPLL